MYRFMQNSVEMKTEIQFPQVNYAVVVFKGQKSATFFSESPSAVPQLYGNQEFTTTK